jgi:hypothetical protein
MNNANNQKHPSDSKLQVPACLRAYKSIWFCLVSLIVSAHFAFGEWVFNPNVILWKEALFWQGLAVMLVGFAVLWGFWTLIAREGFNPERCIVTSAIILAAGDLLSFLIFHNLKHYGIKNPLDYWHWWTWWLPLIVASVNAQLAWRLWWLFGPKRVRTAGPRLRWWEILLRCATVLLVTWASLLTAIHLVVPSMPVSQFTTDVAREFILREHWREDFEFILKNSACRGKKLRAIIQHVELADLQRRHFYTDLDNSMYQRYVLSPDVDRLPLSELHWRRELWENFYPRVRKEKDPMAAAYIVVRFLRQRVGIHPSFNSRVGVETIWIQQMTNEQGFDRIYVAALRSVGIAARLNAETRAELWTGSHWLEAPRPVIVTL